MTHSIEQTFSVCPVCKLGFTGITFEDDTRDVYRLFVHSDEQHCKVIMRESISAFPYKGLILNR